MYKLQTQPQKTSIRRSEIQIGETIEQKVERVTTNKEPIKDGAPLIFTERKDGVQPEYDVRTDRFEVAVDAMDKVTKSHLAKRQSRIEKLQDNTPAAQAASNKNNGPTGDNAGNPQP